MVGTDAPLAAARRYRMTVNRKPNVFACQVCDRLTAASCRVSSRLLCVGITHIDVERNRLVRSVIPTTPESYW